MPPTAQAVIPGVLIVGATPSAGATTLATAVAANLRYLRRLTVAVTDLDSPLEVGTFAVVDCGTMSLTSPPDRNMPAIVVVSEEQEETAAIQSLLQTVSLLRKGNFEILGVIVNGRVEGTPSLETRAQCQAMAAAAEVAVLGVFPRLPAGDMRDPLWLGRAADKLESRVDLSPLLLAAAPDR